MKSASDHCWWCMKRSGGFDFDMLAEGAGGKDAEASARRAEGLEVSLGREKGPKKRRGRVIR